VDFFLTKVVSLEFKAQISVKFSLGLVGSVLVLREKGVVWVKI